MVKKVRIRKQGKFYNAYEDDAYVIHAALGYKVSNGRVGFPITAIGRVQNELEERKINYVVIEKDVEVEKKDFSNNTYNKYFKIGIESVDKIKNYENLILKIKELPPEKIDKILDFIERVISE